MQQQPLDVLIMGAGFSGIGVAINLQKQGVTNYKLIDQGQDFGGTWRDNKYPGAACDVPSHLYSFSFEQNPNWSRMFATSDEIHAYMLDVAAKHQLRPKAEFGVRVIKLAYDENACLWTATAENGKKYMARVVVSGIGALSIPSIPKIEGADAFKGEVLHTARWRKDTNLRGKKVVVVGGGASAIQLVPAIAPEVGKLAVFQRTPSWIIPKPDYEIGETEKSIYRALPFVQRLRRTIIYALTEGFGAGIVFNTPVTNALERLARWNIERSIKDPELRRKVTPDYRFGCKRMLISNDWYPALTRDNVELVASGVTKITPTGVIAQGKEYEADVIIYATGFEVPKAGSPFPIKGARGHDLNNDWKNGAESYLGMTVHGFPNLFYCMGPNTGPGHTSVLVYTEPQYRYIASAVSRMLTEGIAALEVKAEKQAEFTHFIDERMKVTNWTSGCKSWYLTDGGRNTTLYPGFAGEYVLKASTFHLEDFAVVKKSDLERKEVA
ncbi:MAG: NAD(P)/FAD-dependent oxidoreductase [Leptospiraceae bacterium]|nr:NAD(P)/FAD-dependent oxidoreductase [Leptospiraceae bacterium]